MMRVHGHTTPKHKRQDHIRYKELRQHFKSDDKRCLSGPKARDGTGGQVERVSDLWGRQQKLKFSDTDFTTVSLFCQLNVQAILKIFSQLIPTGQKVFK